VKRTFSKWDIDAIVRGAHPDPFSVLGCHALTGKKVVYRVFRPGAKSISVLKSGKEISLEQIHEQGLFETQISGQVSQDYLVQIDFGDGFKHQYRDPYSFSLGLSSYDLQLWGEGSHYNAWKFMGAHYREFDGVWGTHFVVAAPSASRVSVLGTFNHWDGRAHCMRRYFDQGVWEIFIPEVHPGQVYKYEIVTPHSSLPILKSDPFGQAFEVRPNTASLVSAPSHYQWNDADWLLQREHLV
jgi:1,4-alpha-glucan branching enzyme